MNSYRSARVRANWTLVLLGLSGIVILPYLADILRVFAPPLILYGPPLTWAHWVFSIPLWFLSVPMFFGHATLFSMVVFGGAVVALCMWMHRASRNLAALGIAGQPAPGDSAVRWWFRPVTWLSRPHRVLAELWRGSQPHLGTHEEGTSTSVRSSRLLDLLWIMWLLSIPSLLAALYSWLDMFLFEFRILLTPSFGMGFTHLVDVSRAV